MLQQPLIRRMHSLLCAKILILMCSWPPNTFSLVAAMTDSECSVSSVAALPPKKTDSSNPYRLSAPTDKAYVSGVTFQTSRYGDNNLAVPFPQG